MATTIEMIPVQSSNVASVGYDAAARALVVQFRSGGRYQYGNVDRPLYEELLASPSKGRFVAERLVRKPAHPVVRLAPPVEPAP